MRNAIAACPGANATSSNEAVHAVTEQALRPMRSWTRRKVGHGRSDPLVVHAKMLRLELLKVKADLERELEDISLNSSKCGLDVHWVSGLGDHAGSLGAPGACVARRACGAA